jgi:hypothetical protein
MYSKVPCAKYLVHTQKAMGSLRGEAWGGEREGAGCGEEIMGGWKGGEMTQTLYAHINKRKKKRWSLQGGHKIIGEMSLKEIMRPQYPAPSLSAFKLMMRWAVFDHRPKATGSIHHGLETPKLCQNKPFLFISWLSQIFCYINKKPANISLVFKYHNLHLAFLS